MREHKCPGCNEVYPLTAEYFPIQGTAKSGFKSRCRKCSSKQFSEWYQENTRTRKYKKNSEAYKRYCQRVRVKALTYYGGNPPACQCCGESILEFLCIDHINGGGNEHRREVGVGLMFYRWLINSGYPEGFRVLCHNCNWARRYSGKCPHETGESNLTKYLTVSGPETQPSVNDATNEQVRRFL